MKKYILVLAFFNSTLLWSKAQNPFAVANIASQLTDRANAVIRYSDMNVEIKSEKHAVVKTKYAITLLNAAADKHAQLLSHYDKFIRIRSIEGTLYDASGRKIKSLKKNEVQDITGNPDAAFADDSRYKLHNFNWQIYPYTVEYEMEEEMNGIFYLPHWMPLEDEYISLEKSSLTVETPPDYILRYKAFNYTGEPLLRTEKKSKYYSWTLEQVAAYEEESYRPSWHELTPTVFLAPETFEIDGYPGNMSSWQEYGKFIYSLNKGKDELPDAVKTKVHELVNGLGTQQEKVKVLYEYLQRSTHYISIQLGLGGWQPFDANFVASKGYGDCKALSNFMCALLKEAGIKAHYSLIRAGDDEEPILADFPMNQFNHIVVCVPFAKDSTWLECTSQTVACNYMGSFTGNRMALLIDEAGGTIVRTPVYTKEDNLQARKISAKLSENGDIVADIHTLFRAEQQDDIHGFNNALPKERVEQYLKEELSLPSYDLLKFEYREEKSKLPVMTEMLQIKANNYASVSGKRLFINPNMFNQSKARLKDAEKRKHDILLRTPYADIDSVEITVPAGYKAESIPAAVSIETKFGKYSSYSSFKDNKIIYIRKNERNSGRHAPSDAKALAEYFEKIYRADRNRIVLIKESL
ncbi:MAG: transglutaminase-like domain-containing protein [Ferruginibacter sp.]